MEGKLPPIIQQELDNLFHVLACHLHCVCNLIFLNSSTPNPVSFLPAQPSAAVLSSTCRSSKAMEGTGYPRRRLPSPAGMANPRPTTACRAQTARSGALARAGAPGSHPWHRDTALGTRRGTQGQTPHAPLLLGQGPARARGARAVSQQRSLKDQSGGCPTRRATHQSCPTGSGAAANPRGTLGR